MSKKDKDDQLEIDLGDVHQPETGNIIAEDPEVPEDVIVVQEHEPAVDPEVAIEQLKEKLEDTRKKYIKEKKAREEAELAAQKAAQTAYSASNEAEENKIHLVTGAIDTLRREQDYIKGVMKEAMSVGDYDRTVELQEAFQANINKLARLEDGLAEMKANPRRVEPPVPQASALVDDLIQRVSPVSARWLDKNRDHLKDARAIRIMERAHNDADDMGIPRESEEYFALIENRLGISKKLEKQEKMERRESYDDDGDDFSAAAAPVQRRQSAPAAAPVSRSSGGPSSNPRVVRLTPDELEAAKISGISPQQYYNNKMRDKNRAANY